MQRHKNDPRPPHPHPQLPPGSLPPDSRHQTMNVSITRRCSSCDFDEGKDNNKGLQQQGLQMMNPFTSFRSAFDDFRKKFKHWTRTKWICKGEISISRRIWIYASTSAPSPWCYVNKQSIRIRKLFKDFVFLWSSQKRRWHEWDKQLSRNMRSWYSRCGFNEAHIGGSRMFEKWERGLHFAAFYHSYTIYIKQKRRDSTFRYSISQESQRAISL